MNLGAPFGLRYRLGRQWRREYIWGTVKVDTEVHQDGNAIKGKVSPYLPIGRR